jgi:hypothetical protein
VVAPLGDTKPDATASRSNGSNSTAPPPLGSAPPPLGNTAGSSAAPFTGTGLPQVKESNIQSIICQADDTSFTAISRRVYNDEKYAAALAQFNAQCPDRPLPIPGRKVHIPPVSFLEEHFASAIGGRVAPIGTPATVPNNPVVNAFPPKVSEKPFTPDYVPPLGGKPAQIPIENLGGPAPIGQPETKPAPADSRQLPSGDGTKSYRVPEQGESILEVARKTLGGDSKRWPEIYRLNGNVDPAYPIPGGTILRLPASAAVPRQ